MNISEKTKLTFTTANLFTLILSVFSIAGMWFHLNAQIDEAKQLPKQKNDKVVREAVLNMNSDMQYIKTEITEINNRLDKMEDRLYELK
tara:strand:+ start:367 stop:633 length:267 start_codon:yes stop_codon:yes gene_type:complete